MLSVKKLKSHRLVPLRTPFRIGDNLQSWAFTWISKLALTVDKMTAQIQKENGIDFPAHALIAWTFFPDVINQFRNAFKTSSSSSNWFFSLLPKKNYNVKDFIRNASRLENNALERNHSIFGQFFVRSNPWVKRFLFVVRRVLLVLIFLVSMYCLQNNLQT